MREDAPLSATNPYGETKVMMERIITDVAHAQPICATPCCATSIRLARIRQD